MGALTRQDSGHATPSLTRTRITARAVTLELRRRRQPDEGYRADEEARLCESQPGSGDSDTHHRIEYDLTDRGESLEPVITAMAEWGRSDQGQTSCNGGT